MITWLIKDEAGWVFRQDEFGGEPEHIGNINVDKSGRKWFNTTGDNRTFNHAELKQLLTWTS